jgi:AcrR family transcriptional regulator
MNHDWHHDRKQRHATKLNQILRVAASCFNRRGLSGTSLKDVANQLNITDAALYYYVKNKEMLINLCYIRAVDLAFECLQRALESGGTPLDKLKFYLHDQIRVICAPEIGPVAVLTDIPSLKPEFKDPIVERFRVHNDRLEALLDEGVKSGDIEKCNTKLVVANIMGAINWIPKWYHPELGVTAEEIMDSFLQTYCLGLEPR